jgi:uncharacterized protein (DUF1697 family)
MPTFVALLRGVNVGKGRRVPMEALRSLLSGLGYADVKTLLNSGNAVFHATGPSGPAHAKAIAGALSERLSVEVPVIVKTARQLAAVVADNPFADGAPDHSRLLVAFAADTQALAGLKSIETLVAPPEGFAVGRHAAYLHCANGILESKAGEALLGRLGQAATTRNWATTLKLHALAGGAAIPAVIARRKPGSR